MINKYPYTNFHELNDDWIIKTISEVKENMDNFENTAETATETINQSLQQAEAAANAAANSKAEAESIQEQLTELYDQVTEQVETNTNDIAVNSGRIDNIISGASVDPNAELTDIRVEYNGTVAVNAGDAVRNQVSDLHGEVDNIYDILNGIYPTIYSESNYDAFAANTVRWFIPVTMGKGWLQNVLVRAYAQGDVTIELWSASETVFTRYYSKVVNVTNGDNLIEMNVPTTGNVNYISFTSDVTGAIRCLNRNNGSLILRDKTNTSFSLADLVSMNFALSVDVIFYGDTSETVTNKVFIIGQNDNVAEVIQNAMLYENSTVYIEPYTHDCIAEWEEYYGPDYFENMASGRGLELGNGIHIIGRSGHKLTCHYTGENDYVMEYFSLFNNHIGDKGYTLENLNIETSRIRYCIHDERGPDSVPYQVSYKRCMMSQDNSNSTWVNSRACIGGGLGLHGDVLIEDCIFKTVTGGDNYNSLAYHNSGGEPAQNSVVIKNCYCADDSTIQLRAYGPSTTKSKILVANCSVGRAMEIYDWSGNNNFEIYQINNTVRN